MGLYSDQILPRVVDKVLSTGPVMKYREQVVSGLAGRIVEIGFGSGLNIEKYPAAVTHVAAVDPAVVGRELARDRVAASPATIEYVGLDGQSLPLGDESCDGALCTFSLCTIPDASAAIAEVRRVLKPGGSFHVLEHGLARDPNVAKWQVRLTPIQRRVAGGCHLDRDPLRLLRDGGFEIAESEEWFAPGPKPFTANYRIVAVKPTDG